MFRASKILLGLVLSGCATVGPCDYVVGPEWTITRDLPAALRREPNAGSGRWYVRDDGRYLHCPASRSASNCGNIRLEYQPTPDGYESPVDVVCMT